MLFQLRLRGGGPSEEETSQHQVVSVEEEPQPAEPSAKKPLQYGLSKFFGSASEKKAAKPVLELKLPAYTRQGTKSRAQLEAEVAKERYEDRLAELEAEQAGSDLVAIAKKRKLTQGKSFLPQRKQIKQRLELSANKKLAILRQMEEAQPEYAHPEDFWKAMMAKTGLKKAQLQRIMSGSQHLKALGGDLSRKEQLQGLSQQPHIARGQSSKNKRRVRASGAGRKVPIPETVEELRQWLAVERSLGHTVMPSDLFQECISLMRATAAKLKQQASENTQLSPLQKAEYLLKAKDLEERAEKVTQKKSYTKTWTQRLLMWTGAKYTTSELVSNITQLESQVRCQLTWQEFDRVLWLCTLSSPEEFEKEASVVSPQDFCKNRSQLTIGFSDQVPLWAKAPGRKAVFAEQSSADIKDFSEIREAIAEVMSSSEQPGQLVMPLQTPHKTPQRKGSTDSVGSSSVKRSLSFTPDSAKQQPEPKAEEQQQVAEQPKPEPKAEEKQVTSAETESQTPKRLRVTGKQPPIQALPDFLRQAASPFWATQLRKGSESPMRQDSSCIRSLPALRLPLWAQWEEVS